MSNYTKNNLNDGIPYPHYDHCLAHLNDMNKLLNYKSIIIKNKLKIII